LVGKLCRQVKAIKPDKIHSLEFQQLGYLTVAAQTVESLILRLVVNSWGYDLYWDHGIQE
jgi:hypothetical protein